MRLSYRMRCALKRTGQVLLVLLVIAVIAYALWFTWLDRFVVYSREFGAQLDFSSSITDKTGVVAEKPEEKPPVSIFYNDGQIEVESGELGKIKGYYITNNELQTYLRNDPDGFIAKLQDLPKARPYDIECLQNFPNILQG